MADDPVDRKCEILRFLYDKHVVQLNTRRQYEWRAIYAFLGLVIGIDAAILSNRVQLATLSTAMLFFLLAGSAYFVWKFEWEIQKRNATDSTQMLKIHNELVALGDLAQDMKMDETPEFPSPPPHARYAFRAQMALLVAVLLTSFLLVFLLANPRQAEVSQQPVNIVQ